MLVLLPPSEGKADGSAGPPLDLAALSLPGLTAARQAVLAELSGLCAADQEKARDVLGLSARQTGEVVKNTTLYTAPALPAAELYTGVLYDALELRSLSDAARQRAAEQLLVFSGLWGAVRITDRIPSYRCSGGVRLPALGALKTYWRAPLGEALPELSDGGLLFDLRSAAYGGMWQPTGELARRTATARVLHSTRVDGVEKRTVVSHFNKATKGRIVRALLDSGAEPRNPGALAEELRGLGYQVEASPASSRATAATRLDIIVTEV